MGRRPVAAPQLRSILGYRLLLLCLLLLPALLLDLDLAHHRREIEVIQRRSIGLPDYLDATLPAAEHSSRSTVEVQRVVAGLAALPVTLDVEAMQLAITDRCALERDAVLRHRIPKFGYGISA